MKSLFLSSAAAFAAIITLLVPPAKAGDKTTTENRPVAGDFRGISLLGSTDVVVRQGDKLSISVTGLAEEVALTETVIDKNRLVIRQKDSKHWNMHSKGVTVTVVMPALEAVTITGSGDLRTEGNFTGTDLALSVNGSGDLRLAANLSGAVTTTVVGSGDVRLSGRCASHSVKVSGSGDIHAEELQAASATVKISGSGDVSVAASESLDASVSGSGDIRYAGNPKQLVKHVSGSGSIVKL
jgi:Putative auto-transporter adhesin, head GIN domain